MSKDKTNTESDENNKNTNTTTKTIEKFSEKDLVIDGFKLGESAKTLEAKYGNPDDKADSQSEESTGIVRTRLGYTSKGIIVDNATTEQDSDGSIIRIELTKNCKFATARGIKIGSSAEEISKVYPSDSILKNETGNKNLVIVGYPGEDPIYEDKHGKIYFHLVDGKINKIVFAYAIAE